MFFFKKIIVVYSGMLKISTFKANNTLQRVIFLMLFGHLLFRTLKTFSHWRTSRRNAYFLMASSRFLYHSSSEYKLRVTLCGEMFESQGCNKQE